MPAELKSTFGALPRTVRGQPVVISGKEDKKTFLYTHGNSVFIRNIEDPAICDVYTEHIQQTTVAKYSPSGFYIASADVAGRVRIWDTVNIEHMLKNEYQPFAGPVKDLDWSGDSQRIVVGGEGREKFSHVFSADTGTSVGELLGHSKAVNAVSFKANRPFRIATASEDQSLCFYHGPPFKLNMQISDHTNFVNTVSYSSDGNKFVSGGADGRAYVYDGKTAEKVLELGSPAHKGGIYSLCFSPNNSEVITVSGDKTAKIWNVETGELVCDFVMGTTIPDMQLGCLWQGEFILTVSLSGNISYLDRSNPSSPSRVIKGHSKQINALLTHGDTLYSADADGKICVWDVATGTCNEITGAGHKAQVQSLSLDGDVMVSCSVDDTVKNIDVALQSYTDTSTKMESQPQSIATNKNAFTAVACLNEIVVLQDGNVLFTQKVNYEPSAVEINPSGTDIAVAGFKDSKVHIYSINGGTLQETHLCSHAGSVTCLSYSPDGAYLAAGDANRKVVVYNCPDYEKVVSDEWTAHTAKILCLAWSPDCQHLASGSIDTNIIIWDVNDKSKKTKIDRAHKMSAVSALAWRNENELISAGHDANIKLWAISH